MRSNLTPRQHLSVTLLSSGLTARQVANELHVSEKTLCKWGQNEAFRSEVNRKLLQAEEEAAALLGGLRLKAVERLNNLLLSANENIAIRAVSEVLDRQKPPNIHTSEATQGHAVVDLALVLRGLGLSHG